MLGRFAGILFFAWVSILFLGAQVARADLYDDCYKKVEAQYGPYTDVTWMHKVWQCTGVMASEEESSSKDNVPHSTGRPTNAGSLPAPSPAPVPIPRSTTNAKKNGGVSKFDPKTQELCVKVLSSRPENFQSGGVKYHYDIANSCKRGFSVTIVTKAGWTVSRDVPGTEKIEWYCTDGRKENRNCNGGMDHLEF